MDKKPHAGAYTSPPDMRKAAGKTKLIPIGAGVVAAAAGLAWFFSPGAAPKAAPVPEAPPAGPALEMPQTFTPRPRAPEAPEAPRVELRQAEARPAQARRIESREGESERPPSMDTSAPAAATRPAWANARPPQKWSWPRHVGVRGTADSIDRRLVGYYPANAEARRMQYSLTIDREETQLYEDEIPAFEERIREEAEAEARRKAGLPPVPRRPVRQSVRMNIDEIRRLERDALQKKKGAVSVRDATVAGGARVAELTYANGRKEVVPYDPLVFDLKGGGIKTSVKKVLFDLYAYGKSDKTQWMNDLEEGSGILVFDATGSGRSGKNGGEVFGDRTDLTGVGQPSGFANGFEALRALVTKAVAAGVLGREVLDQGILDAKALAALEKAYGLKMKIGGFNRESVSLAAAGVKAIALSQEPTQWAPNFDGQSNALLIQPGAVFQRTDGTTSSYMNVWLTAKLGNLGLKSTVAPNK